ncbi:hypothetical protein RUM43_003203 [Polyplax serrata]|uniref:Uncharacterized protein n=1 Tax=Polyplax serrata TaxID=468196 RepID=A0AAN8P1R5_POLSC
MSFSLEFVREVENKKRIERHQSEEDEEEEEEDERIGRKIPWRFSHFKKRLISIDEKDWYRVPGTWLTTASPHALDTSNLNRRTSIQVVCCQHGGLWSVNEVEQA